MAAQSEFATPFLIVPSRSAQGDVQASNPCYEARTSNLQRDVRRGLLRGSVGNPSSNRGEPSSRLADISIGTSTEVWPRRADIKLGCDFGIVVKPKSDQLVRRGSLAQPFPQVQLSIPESPRQRL
jgi:hypothetical protein